MAKKTDLVPYSPLWRFAWRELQGALSQPAPPIYARSSRAQKATNDKIAEAPTDLSGTQLELLY